MVCVVGSSSGVPLVAPVCRASSFHCLLICAGMFGLELARIFPRSTIVTLEPNSSMWHEHTGRATALRQPNILCLLNPVSEEVAEALSHSNEFLDAQLALSLHTAKPFDHGVSTRDKMERLDKFVGHILSLARRTLLLLPATLTPGCADNRLANWAHAEPILPSSADGSNPTVPARLSKAAKTLNMRLKTQRVLSGITPDGCEHDIWEVELVQMTRLNRHHFCLGGCKTHTRRSYQMNYSVSKEGDWVMNMSNMQTGRRIPFDTGSMNMHSLLSLHMGAAQQLPPAQDISRQVLLLMFLSLPIFQDPAPWNVVWRAGELFPIDVGDGTTYEGRWATFAQKYIGSLNECYRMSLKTLCGFGSNGQHGDDQYDSCMAKHFEGICSPSHPYPCMDGCNKSYQGCGHLRPHQVTRGYLSANPLLRAHPVRFAQYAHTSVNQVIPDDRSFTANVSTSGDVSVAEDVRFGLPVVLDTQRNTAALRRQAPAKIVAGVEVPRLKKSRSGTTPKSKNGKSARSAGSSVQHAGGEANPTRDGTTDYADRAAPIGDTRTSRVVQKAVGGAAPAGRSIDGEAGVAVGATPTKSQTVKPDELVEEGEEGVVGTFEDAKAGLLALLHFRGLQHESDRRQHSRSLQVGPPHIVRFYGYATLVLQLTMLAWVATLLCNRSITGRRLLRIVRGRVDLERRSKQKPVPVSSPAPTSVPAQDAMLWNRALRRIVGSNLRETEHVVDSRLLGELE